ncbi:MAG: lipocalin family protein [Woeseiaceae bacterium]|nr:lipocalin family protein [Woeseiaceae bacterium]
MYRPDLRLPLLFVALFSLAGCATRHPPMDTVDYVDLERFMGDWYVIANIPTFVEKGAHNAVETYELNPDGTVATTFRFREDSFDGEVKEYNPKGFIRDEETNALWGMQFIWPIKGDYRIVYLDESYTQTIIGRKKRDFIWIMARTPEIPEADFRRLVEFAGSLGYDTSKIEPVPQRWPENRESDS